MKKIIIKPKSEEEYSQVIEMLQQMGIEITIMEPIKPKLKKERPNTTPLYISKETLPPIVPMSLEEFNAMINRSIEEADAGKIITNDELKKNIIRWH